MQGFRQFVSKLNVNNERHVVINIDQFKYSFKSIKKSTIEFLQNQEAISTFISFGVMYRI